MSDSMYLLTLGLFFGTVLLIFALKYLSSIVSNRAQVVDRERYYQLAEESRAVQEQLTRELASLRAELAGIAERTADIQQVLRQVE
ncbi:hypothetical protein [Deinococcus hopiensis]|uniref:Uncharacterized protein n=1 Tax=Deinococcus hopiensis KR-140 TaxID=695939 RepID=A0A1W1ULK1_9DEIO|nr:hypothetical protein [Deinococcus hopiensis]SMB81614.1 hypothetical protein SAMN00790413_04642 [Deinococcus hopiensis KR-140]